MRLFIALSFPDPFVKYLEQLQQEMKELGISGRYTRSENLHITLAFIGELPDAQKAAEVLNRIPFPGFVLETGSIGHFGSLYFLETAPNEALQDYVKRLRAALKEAGIPFDGKPFRPHITLLRQGRLPQGIQIRLEPQSVCCTQAVLFQSLQENGKLVYRRLDSVSC